MVPPPTSIADWNSASDSSSTGCGDSPTQEEFIMPAGVSQLVVWPLSGRHQSRSEGLPEGASRLLESSWREIRPNQHMSHSSNVGSVGVRSGLEIPLGVL